MAKLVRKILEGLEGPVAATIKITSMHALYPKQGKIKDVGDNYPQSGHCCW